MASTNLALRFRFAGNPSAGAIFDPSRLYRYVLWRAWEFTLPPMLWVMLNPSTADEFQLDPTVAKCVRYAKRWGAGGIYVCNVFAWRATDPKQLKLVDDPVGPDNDRHILDTAERIVRYRDIGLPTSYQIVCAWGRHAGARGVEVRAMLDAQNRQIFGARQHHPLVALGFNKNGSPVHPLYQRDDQVPLAWE